MAELLRCGSQSSAQDICRPPHFDRVLRSTTHIAKIRVSIVYLFGDSHA